MKRTICVLAALLPLFFSSCKEEQPSEPQTSGDASALTVTISPAGGELRAEGFALIVPPGAFATSAELQLTILSSEKPFGSSSVSGTFQIDGFPTEFSQPLTVLIKHDGRGGTGDYLAVGAPATYSGVEGIDLAYTLVSATDSTGCLVGTIDPLGSPSVLWRGLRPRSSTFRLYLNAVTGYEEYGAGDPHYRFVFPRELDASTRSLFLERFQEAVTRLKPVLSRDDLPSSRGKIPVIIRSKGAQTAECAGWTYLVDEIGEVIWINEDRLGDLQSSEMLVQIGESVFFSLAFHHLDKASGPLRADFWATFWFHTACATWTNELFAPSGTIPRRFPGHEYAPFNGLLPSAGSGLLNRSHGYGMSAFIHFLVETRSVGVLKEIYDDLASGLSLFAAIQAAAAQNMGLVWYCFLREHLEGRIYRLDLGRLLQENWGEYSIASDEDSLRIFSMEYRHLSARLFLVNLAFDPDNPTVAATTSLVLRIHPAGAGGDVLAYKYLVDSLAYVGTSTDSIQISNLVAIRSSGCRTIVAVVVNQDFTDPQSGKTEIGLEAKLRRKIQYVWNTAAIGLYGFKASMKYIVGGEEQEYTSTPNLVQEATGQFEGSSFVGTMTDRAQNGTFTITFDPERLFVAEFGFEYEYDDGDNWGDFKLSGNNVTLERYWYLNENQEIEFRLSGAEIKSQGTECVMRWGRHSTEEESILLGWDAEPETDLKIRLTKNP